MTWSPLALLLGFAVLQATMLATALWSQQPLTRATLALSGLLLALATTLIVPLLQALGLAQEWPRVMIVLSGLPFLFGPLLLVHVGWLTGQERWIRAQTWIVHALLPLAYVLLASWLLRRSEGELAALFAPTTAPRLGILPLSKLLSVLVYTGLSWLLLQRFERRLREQLAETDAFAMRGLRALVWSAAALAVLMAMHVALGIGTSRQDEWFAAAVSLLILLAGFHGLRQPRVPAELSQREAGPSADAPSAAASEAATRVPVALALSASAPPVAGSDLPALAQQVRAVARDPVHLFDHDLNLARLARACRLTQNQLSHVLNHGLGEGFYDFINRLRVEAVQARLLDPAQQGRPILDQAFECGFSTKTTFNKAFRSVTGQTPSAWRESERASGPGAPRSG